MIFCPKGCNMMAENQITSLVKMSIDFGSSCHGEDSLVFCNVWRLKNDELIPAISSIPRHFRKNSSCSVHVIFVCHGENGCLVWNYQKRISTREVLLELNDLMFAQLDSVSILGCESLKSVDLPNLSFDLLGFNSYFFWNEFPIFVARYIKEYFAGEELADAVRQAVESCSVSKVTPFPADSLVLYRSNKD